MTRRMEWCVLAGVVLGLAAGCIGDDGGNDYDREAVSSTTSAVTRTFSTGTLVIPLDTTSQDAGALRAYGLVYQLLRNNVPVQWAILTGKPAGANDFTITAPATVKNLETSTAIAVPIGY